MKNIQVAIAVVENEKGQLLFQHRKKHPYQGYLGLVGGKIKDSETKELAMFRELEEEAGIVSRQAQFLGEVIENLTEGVKITVVSLSVFSVKAGEKLKASESEGDVFWVDKSSFLAERGKYIPVDWLIVESIIHHTSIVSKIEVKNLEGTYEIQSVK